MNLDKLSIFEAGLNDGMVEVHVIKTSDLVAPAFLVFPCMFVYGLNLPNPIPDLTCDQQGIRATLSFNQTPHLTFVPWAAVLCIVLAEKGIAVSWKPDRSINVALPGPPARKKPSLKSV
jgi:hypothetical protein